MSNSNSQKQCAANSESRSWLFVRTTKETSKPLFSYPWRNGVQFCVIDPIEGVCDEPEVLNLMKKRKLVQYECMIQDYEALQELPPPPWPLHTATLSSASSASASSTRFSTPICSAHIWHWRQGDRRWARPVRPYRRRPASHHSIFLHLLSSPLPSLLLYMLIQSVRLQFASHT